MRSFTSSRRPRRGQTGAAFVESLIVISMILFVLFAVLWLKSLYTAKLQTIQYARAKAWTSALSACPEKKPEGPETGVAIKSAVNLAKSNGNGSDANNNEDTAGLNGNTDGNDSPEWFNLKEGGSATESVDGFKGFTNGQDMKLSTTRRFRCNERPNPKELTVNVKDLSGDLASIVRDLFD